MCGEILVSVVVQLAAGKDFLFADRGAVALRGFDDPVRLFEAFWREPSRPFADPSLHPCSLRPLPLA